MQPFFTRRQHPRFAHALSFLAILLGGLPWEPARAWDETPTVIQVEEDWELVVGSSGIEPEPPLVAPALSHVGDVDPLHSMFTFNPRDDDGNLIGGMQMSVHNLGATISSQSANAGLSTTEASETIRWTRRMQLANGLLRFSVASGESTTWGAFSGFECVFQTNVADLGAYNSNVSVEGSGVGAASYRVESLVLKQVRRYLSNGDVQVDETPRTVHPR